MVIKYKDLSVWLKALVIIFWINVGYNFITGFIRGFERGLIR